MIDMLLCNKDPILFDIYNQYTDFFIYLYGRIYVSMEDVFGDHGIVWGLNKRFGSLKVRMKIPF